MSERVPISEMNNFRDMLEELLAVEHGLTNKEIDFLDSLNDWEGCFTVPQANWLEKIYERLI